MLAGLLTVAGTPAQAASVAPAAVPDYQLSWGCPGDYPNRATFYFDRGVISTTIHFVNQCASRQSVMVVWADGDTACMSVNGKTSGKKKYGSAIPITRLKKGC